LYGKRIDVEFVAKLRDEAKFADLDTMVKQIDRDAAEAREILDTRRPGEGRDPVLASGTTTGFRPSPE
jgi:riboflavin kinase/FMN adenylyltransferase